MCIFSKPVIDVSDTKIFARRDGNYQYIAYQMNFEANQELAMILPIPVASSINGKQLSEDEQVQFVDFSEHKDFFAYLHEMTEPMLLGSRGMKGSFSKGTLKVHKVGNFEASFVPSLVDFSRLDERFKLKNEIWDQIPKYANYGFVVFKLHPDSTTVHPMVFKFAMNDQTKLFFPTVHIHDGLVHNLEHFNHVLYCQTEEPDKRISNIWRNGAFAHDKKTYKNVLKPDYTIHKRIITGTQRNEDQWLTL